MTAPLKEKVRCMVTGHDWRRAIAPRDGYYLRCRRCWVSRAVEEQAEQVDGNNWATGRPATHSHAA